ncbi:MAG: 3-deoxy-manno-octulosonate cytidylyltransferase [Planctomycetes bacterium]|nr:3-deoxy-manno-octulosonate cytidylyltransferase [Planctomycetota bacterium]
MPATIVIPARYESQRFPGKVLADRTGKPLIQHVWERAGQAASARRVVIATDDERIRVAAEAFGAVVIMTRRDHPNGTSRIAEAAAHLDTDLVVNVQGDEPEIEPKLIDLAVDAIVGHGDCPVSTVASPFDPEEDPADPNVVKVVVDARGRALYFSRALIPHDRDGAGAAAACPLKHLGLYVYRRPFLSTYVRLAPTPLETTERLEQLRVLEHGFGIAVAIGNASYTGIDTPEQYDAFVARSAGTT